MLGRTYIAAIFIAGLLLLPAETFAQGEIQITHSKAVAGGVTPGDTAGYPVILSTPGAYILASNLVPGPNLYGIVATVPDITIDLNGFRISGGPAGGTNNARGGILGQADRLKVMNGTIGGFEYIGVSVGNRSYLTVENMTIVNNYYGIYTTGSFARIKNNTVATNSYTGITCGASCHVEGNLVSSNGWTGVAVPSGTLLGNTIMFNAYFGVLGISTPSWLGLGNNTVSDNNNGSTQVGGFYQSLDPNVCQPVDC